METSELLKKVRKIEIKTKGLSRHLFSGEYHSVFKGRGMSFSEVRSYQYGDDVRNIDWNVTARTGDPHIKIFEEERELTMMLLIDVSRSVYYGSGEQTKVEFITELAAVLAFAAIQNNDKVGLIMYSDHVEKYIPAKKGKKHILRIIREMINFEPKAVATDMAVALQYLNNVIKKRCICFLLSDFIADDYEKPLRLVARRHDLIAIKVFDPAEQLLPQAGLVRVRDAESGKIMVVDTSSEEFRAAYQKRFESIKDSFKTLFKKNGVDTIALDVTKSYIKVLLQFFKQRQK